MKYLCLVYGEEKTLDGLSRGDMEKLVHDSLAYDDVLARSGRLVVAHALESVKAAATLRERNGKLAMTDGPFAETKEQLLGFILIDARDHDDALEVAAKIPLVRLGSVELRPIRRQAQK